MLDDVRTTCKLGKSLPKFIQHGNDDVTSTQVIYVFNRQKLVILPNQLKFLVLCFNTVGPRWYANESLPTSRFANCQFANVSGHFANVTGRFANVMDCQKSTCMRNTICGMCFIVYCIYCRLLRYPILASKKTSILSIFSRSSQS